MTGSETAIVYSFQTGERLDHEFGTEFAEQRAPETLRALGMLGLHERLLAIAEPHIRNLHLGFVSPGVETDASFLEVMRGTNEADRSVVWDRFMLVSERELKSRQQLIYKAVSRDETADGDRRAIKASQSASLDWVFYDLAFQAAGNAVYMQHYFGRYINDFNGQRAHYQAHLEIANEPELTTARAKFAAMQRGFGLFMLHDVLVRYSLAEDLSGAREVILALKSSTPALHDSMKMGELQKQLELVPAVPDHNPLREYSLANHDPELED